MEPENKDVPKPDTESATSEDDTAEGSPPNAPLDQTPAEEPTEESIGQPSGMPDASSLLTMAGMMMPTAALLHALVAVFDNHAWRSMGLVADETGEVRKDIATAQTAIDCLAFIVGKIEGTLEDSEKRDIQRRLTDLRMNYVAKLREG